MLAVLVAAGACARSRDAPAAAARRARGRPPRAATPAATASAWTAWSRRPRATPATCTLRLRPILREIAADGLRRHGVELDAQPQAAQELLRAPDVGAVRPDHPRPADSPSRAACPKQLDAVLDDLEALLDKRRAASRHVAAPAEAILDEVERPWSASARSSSWSCSRCSPTATCSSRTCRAWPRRCIARSLAAATGLRFGRIQFTPDLLPSDVTGSSVFDQRAASFEFRPGPVFCNLLLGDEINRAPPKTQAALLEAMEERQVTADDGTHPLEPPLPGARHAEPDRVRGDLPAARGAARPLPGARPRRLPERPTTSGACSTAARAAAPRRSRCTRWSTAAGCAACRPRSRPSTWATPSGATWSPSPRRRARAPR